MRRRASCRSRRSRSTRRWSARAFPLLAGKKLCLVSILRAGNGILDGMLDLLPSARVGHIGIYRDPRTLQAIEYYLKLPDDLAERDVILVDPMLATGNSAVAAISRLKELAARSIKFVCLVAAPEGVDKVSGVFPEVTIVAAALDRGLDAARLYPPRARRCRRPPVRYQVTSPRRDAVMNAESSGSAYDAVIIGTGQAGPALARRLAAAGRSVAIVERGLFGGTCVNTGCIPTKTLIASAHAMHMARRAGDFGVVVEGPLRADMARVKARKDAVSGQSRDGLEESLRALENCTVFQGHARLVSAHGVQVGGALLTAERIFINVGGRAVVPGWPGLDEVAYLTNSSMMAVDFLPPHLVIVGGGYVGLEFAQMYRRFGSEVTVVEMAPRLIHHEDPDVSAAIGEILEREGVNIRVGATCIRVRKDAEDIVVGVDCTAGAPEVHGSHLLVAVGRRPNTDDLGLERAGISSGRARLYHRRRSTAHQCAGGLGARRLQRPGRLYPHRL